MECGTQKLNFVVYAFWITSTGVVMSDRSTASPARNEVFTVSCFFFFNELVVEGIFYVSFLLLENTARIHNRASGLIIRHGFWNPRQQVGCRGSVFQRRHLPLSPSLILHFLHHRIQFPRVPLDRLDLLLTRRPRPHAPVPQLPHRSPETGQVSLLIS